MSPLKIFADIDKAARNIDKATQAVDKISAMFASKPAPPKKPLTAEEREKAVKARIREKGLQPLFRDIYPDL
jgi:hypothetical protein